MASKHDLIHSIIVLLKHNQDSSHNTRSARKKRLLQMAKQLAEGGYKIAHIQQLKTKHVEYPGEALVRARPHSRNDKKPHDRFTLGNE